MGLIRDLVGAASGAVRGAVADQWREYFYCDTLPNNVLAVKGQKRSSANSVNIRGGDNIISNGSIIAVNDGQCMLIVEQGKVVEFCAEPGEFVWDSSTEPSLFAGKLGTSIVDTFKTIGKRFTFGGEAAKDQRVYYINTKEIMGNKYGTAAPVPFRVVDTNIGLDMDISIKCFGEYSYRITDPLLFYTNVCGNITTSYDRSQMDSQFKSDLLTALQPAFGKISAMGVRYSALPGYTQEIADALNEQLSNKWVQLRGVSVVSFGINSVSADEDDEQMIKELQRTAVMRNPGMAGATLVTAQADAMRAAAANEATGPMMAFAGFNMAQQAGGMNAQNLFAMNQQRQQPVQQAPAAPAAPAAGSWTCACGQVNTGKFCANCGEKKPEPKPAGWTCPACGTAGNTGKFCMECGAKQPAQADGWTCTCGAVNKGKFCSECGAKKPAGVPQYKCDKCGWEPADPTKAPKFCPECGDPFDAGDIV